MRKWIRDIWTAVVTNLVVTLIVALFGFVVPLLVPWLKGLSTYWKIVISLSSAILSVLVFLTIRCRIRRPDDGREPFVGAPEELVMNLNRVAEDQQKERIFTDSRHHFSEIKASYEVKGFDGFYSVLYAGRNVSRKASRSTVCLAGGDSAIDRHLLKLHVTRIHPPADPGWEFLEENETPFRKPFRIYFPSPLEKGGEFAFEVSCCWPGTFGRKEDYVFFPVQRFRRGIQVLRLQVVLSSRPIRYEGVVLKRGRYKIAKTQPVLEETAAGWSIAVMLQKPRRLYVIWFTRRDI